MIDGHRLVQVGHEHLSVHAALGCDRAPTARLRHIAYLGVRTRDFAFTVHDRIPPATQFRVRLDAPDGSAWEWGPADAAQSVTGPVLDFCRLVTQRVHRDDTALVATGPDADTWLGIAQAFAGPPGTGRAEQARDERAGR